MIFGKSLYLTHDHFLDMNACLYLMLAVQEPMFILGSSWRKSQFEITTRASVFGRLYEETAVLTSLLS